MYQGVTNNPLSCILSNIKEGRLLPCYLLYGDEDYLIKDALGKIIDAILPAGNRELNLFMLDGEKENADAIRNFILTPPLIPGEKVVVVQNPEFLRAGTALPQVIAKALDVLDSDPGKAARHFMSFLKKSGWKLEDLQNGNWKSIPDSDWRKVLSGEEFEKRDQWLPRMLELCSQYGLTSDAEQGSFDLEEVLRQMPSGNYLILTTDSIDKRKNVYKAIAAAGDLLDFTRPKNETRLKEIAASVSRDILAESGKSISPAAFSALGKKTGFDLKKMTGEIEKLAAYAGDNSSINERDIEALINKTREESIFALTGAVAERNAGKALAVLKDLLDQGLQPLMIFAMVVREIRLLLSAKLLLNSGKLKKYHSGLDYFQFQKTIYPSIKDLDRSDSDAAGLHPFVLYNALKNSSGFSMDECIGFLDYLLNADIAMKTTGQDPGLIIENLLIHLCDAQSTDILS